MRARAARTDPDALVVGAGISGLATAYELARRGSRVLVLEAEGIGAAQSRGLTRIFRIAHASPRMCGLALEARAAWRRWESELGAGRLLGGEGLVVAGAAALGAQGAAMTEAGAAVHALDRAELRARLPVLGARSPWDAGILDPAGGALRIQRALRALAARVEVRRATVAAVEAGPDAAAAVLADGTRIAAGAVVLCAGLGTGPLAATAGLEHDVEAFHHVRLTYERRPEAGGRCACLIAPGAYGLPVGSTGRWALGLDDPGDPLPVGAVPPEDASARTRAQHAAWVRRVLPGVVAEPVDEIRCVSLRAPWLDAHGDGFAAVRAGRIVAFAGSNVMKFGPLIGERLAGTVLDPGGEVHPDLRPALRRRAAGARCASRAAWPRG